MKRLIALVAAACLSGVGFAAPAAASSAPNDYLSTGRYDASFAEFTVSGSDVVGVVYVDTVEGSNPNAYLSSQSLQFTGTDSGGNLTLFFGGSWTPTFGSVNGQSLSLQIPQSDGTLQTFTFSRSSVAAYNRYIAQWKAAITKANQAAAAAAAKVAAAAQHKQQLLNRLNQTIAAVESDLSVLSSPGTLSDDENTLGDDVNTVGDDLNTVEDDMNTVSDDHNSGESHSVVCGDVSTSYGDAATAASDARVIVSDAQASQGGVGEDLRDALQAMSRTPGDYAAYWQAQHALPSYEPTNPIPPLKVALATGQGTINGAIHQVNSYLDQANGTVAKAYGLANGAQKANHCGPPKSAPVIGHVTAAMLGA
jgi:uncharacterized protein YoxC